MTHATDQKLLDTVLDSWNRNNTILVNLLNALPEGGMDARAMEGSPTIAALYTHIRDVRLFFVSQTAPEFAGHLPELFREESADWQAERDPALIVRMLEDSARAVQDAVTNRIDAGLPLKGAHVAYDHPLLLLQHLLWHEGYHVGQLMLALKAAGRPVSEPESISLIWDVWRKEW